MDGVKVVQQSQVKPIGKHPRGGVFSIQGEFLLLENELRRIVVFRLDNWTETFRILLEQVATDAIWYMPSKDGIVLLQREVESGELTFVLFLNWRIPSPRNPKCSVPPPAKKPNNWRFEPPDSGFHSFALGVYRPNSNVVAQIHGNSIVIVSEAMALFWDISDRPVLRFLLLLPPPLVRPTFSFLGDRLAIVVQGTLLILQTVAGVATAADEPFSPGSKCFELRETLVPHFGVTQDNVNAHSLFIVRHLPSRPVSVQILYEWRPPCEPKQIAFIPPTNTLLMLTSLGVFACRPGSGEPGTPNYLAEQLSPLQGATQIDFNRDFLMLANSSKLSVFPNPEKAGLQFGDSFQLLEELAFTDILFIASNAEFCVVVTATASEKGTAHKADHEEAAIHVLKFKDVNALAQRLSASSDLNARRTGLRLKNPSDGDFANSVYTIGMQLLKTSSSQISNAVLYLTKAFNSGLPDSQRQSILEEIRKIRQYARKRHFIQEAVFRGNELSDDFLTSILNLPPPQAIRKLIQAKRFDRSGDFGDIPEAVLFNAISASFKSDHDQARVLFQKVPSSLFKLLDDELLSKISGDLTPQILIAIGKPDLENSQWDIAERRAAFHFAQSELISALEIAAQNLDANWHFDEWPVKPTLVDWVDGNEMMRFAAGCYTAFNVPERAPAPFAALAAACTLAKDRRFRQALDKVGSSIYPFEFLRCFAKDPASWAAVIAQVDDPDVQRCAIHYLISFSPKRAYKAIVTRMSTVPGLQEIADDLRENDKILLEFTSGPRPLQ
jgi:hypothetical protein